MSLKTVQSAQNSKSLLPMKDVCNTLSMSPAKARKLENVMRGMSQHGHTSIGFGNNATPVQVNDLYPMVFIF